MEGGSSASSASSASFLMSDHPSSPERRPRTRRRSTSFHDPSNAGHSHSHSHVKSSDLGENVPLPTSSEFLIPPASDLLPYQIGDCIGKGSFGSVYKGLNVESGEFVAIKVVALFNMSKTQLEKVMDEFYILENLGHENIVKYYSVRKSRNHISFIMEFVENGSLTSMLKKFGNFNERLLGVYLKQVLRGLEFLHSNKLAHRDIKGSNVLITKDGTCKICDFGVSAIVDHSQKSSTVVGTPYWMAPEIITLKQSCVKSDIWSVGCMALELLTGFPPFYKLGPMAALFHMVSDEHPEFPPTLSPLGHDFLIHCFKKDVKERYSASQLLAHPFLSPPVLDSPLGMRPLIEDDEILSSSSSTSSISAGTDALVAEETSALSKLSIGPSKLSSSRFGTANVRSRRRSSAVGEDSSLFRPVSSSTPAAVPEDASMAAAKAAAATMPSINNNAPSEPFPRRRANSEAVVEQWRKESFFEQMRAIAKAAKAANEKEATTDLDLEDELAQEERREREKTKDKTKDKDQSKGKSKDKDGKRKGLSFFRRKSRSSSLAEETMTPPNVDSSNSLPRSNDRRIPLLSQPVSNNSAISSSSSSSSTGTGTGTRTATSSNGGADGGAALQSPTSPQRLDDVADQISAATSVAHSAATDCAVQSQRVMSSVSFIRSEVHDLQELVSVLTDRIVKLENFVAEKNSLSVSVVSLETKLKSVVESNESLKQENSSLKESLRRLPKDHSDLALEVKELKSTNNGDDRRSSDSEFASFNAENNSQGDEMSSGKSRHHHHRSHGRG